eukprot:2392293-Prorocentrum_lima.AAC.1
MAIKEVKLLKQDITQMKDTLASAMTVLESTIPSGRKIEGRLKELDKSLLEIKKEVQGVDKGLKFAVEQMDQLEQNLGLQHDQPVSDRRQPASRAPPGLPQ